MKAEAVVVDPRNEDTVMRYLRENPDFFGRHPMLLTDLSLPHDSGEAISLVERQVAILRERNIDMRRRLTHLVGAANTNDTLFEKTRRFTLNMLDCDDLETVDHLNPTVLWHGPASSQQTVTFAIYEIQHSSDSG